MTTKHAEIGWYQARHRPILKGAISVGPIRSKFKKLHQYVPKGNPGYRTPEKPAQMKVTQDWTNHQFPAQRGGTANNTQYCMFTHFEVNFKSYES